MAVVGFDIGNNCYVSVAKAGGIETVANEYSERCTPAIVAFNRMQRLVGMSAKNQMATNYKSTVTQVKRLIGRKYDEPSMEAEFARLPYTCVKMDNGDIGIKVKYRDEERKFLPEQVLAMILTYLKQTAENDLNAKVSNCVVSVPVFYTEHQRKAVLCASRIAGLNCLKVISEPSAVALCYGLFKQQELPAAGETPRHVAFIDMGHSSYQVCIAAFNKGRVQILSTAWDKALGGRDFDNRLAEYFADEFLKKYRVDARSDKRAWIRLGTEVEKIKKQLSMNTTRLPLNIECFMNDTDVSHSINRVQFEEMCADLITRAEPPLIQALNESGLTREDIDVVEVVGGSSRIPALRAIFEAVFKKSCSTTLNQDEAVVRGCAIQCAMFSHTVKVRDIKVIDVASYPVYIVWDCDGQHSGEAEVFARHHAYPFTKILSFPRSTGALRFRAYYNERVKIPYLTREIGEFIVNSGVHPASTSGNIVVKVRVCLDDNGFFTVLSASTLETSPLSLVKFGEVMETNENNGHVAIANEEEEMEEVGGKDQKTTNLIIDKKENCRTGRELNLLIEIENELISQMKLEKERVDAKNSVEEYVYCMRDKIHTEYEKYLSDIDRERFSSFLTNTEDWLYEEGGDLSKAAYTSKLDELKKLEQPVVERYEAHTALCAALEEFSTSLQHYRKILDLYSQQDGKYAHIEASEMKKVERRLEDWTERYNVNLQTLANYPLHRSPLVLPLHILNEKTQMESYCDKILNKSRPKAVLTIEDETGASMDTF